MTEIGTDWRVVDGLVTAWFEAPSLTAGAELARSVAAVSADTTFDLRATGVRVRLESAEHTETVSEAARRLGIDQKIGRRALSFSESNSAEQGRNSRRL
jgi:hypothetical protein